MPNPFIDIRTKQLPGLGRKTLLRKAISIIELGEHVSIVGPRFMGKSCFVRALVQEPALRGRFAAIAVLDIRHAQISSNSDFFTLILQKLDEDPLIQSDWKDFTKPTGNSTAWNTLFDLGKGMASENTRMLIVLDGLDELAISSTIDSGAWNNLNSLIDTGGFQFITSSCEELGDICLDPQSKGSLFFTRFSESLSLPCVNQTELAEWLQASTAGAGAFDSSAQKELLAQSGGHPKLLAALLAQLPEGAIGVQVNAIADELTQSLSSDVVSVFNELKLDWRVVLSTLDDAGRTTPLAKKALLARGMVQVGRSGRLDQNCRMIAKLAERSKPGESTMRELFGSEEVYFKNSVHALKLRLLTVAGSSQHPIFRNVGLLLENLDAIDFALNGAMRPLEDEAINEIDKLVGKPFPQLETKDPPRGFKSSGKENRSYNIRVVECLTREECGYNDPKLPRSIYVLLNTIHAAGNYATHPQGQALSRGFALALATAALELAGEMNRTGLIR